MIVALGYSLVRHHEHGKLRVSVLDSRAGVPRLLAGRKAAVRQLDSRITETRNFPVFMVPDEEYPNATIIDFPKLFCRIERRVGSVKRVGLVGAGRMPADCYKQIVSGFTGAELVDITAEYVQLRSQQIRLGALADSRGVRAGGLCV